MEVSDRNKVYTKALKLTRAQRGCGKKGYMCVNLLESIGILGLVDTSGISEMWEFKLFEPDRHVGPWFCRQTGFWSENNESVYYLKEVKDIQETILLFCIEMTNP